MLFLRVGNLLFTTDTFFYKPLVQLDLLFDHAPSTPLLAHEEFLPLGSRTVRVWMIPNHRARRYVLRLTRHGIARVTIPRRGTLTAGRKFLTGNRAWLEKQLLRHDQQQSRPRVWQLGSELLLRGERVRLELATSGFPQWVRLGLEQLQVEDPSGDLRVEVEGHLWRLAARELPPRVQHLAELHKFGVRRISVRNQRSRWGSCSRKGTISLNWRLIQAPDFVRDYIILHELAHLRHMNHSASFWSEVRRLCPDFEKAEAWLKEHSELLR